MVLTSNRGFAEWGEVFGDAVVATALLDRLLHHAQPVVIEGDSYCSAKRKWPRIAGRTAWTAVHFKSVESVHVHAGTRSEGLRGRKLGSQAIENSVGDARGTGRDYGQTDAPPRPPSIKGASTLQTRTMHESRKTALAQGPSSPPITTTP